ncbi:MAG TPA: GMP synthase [Microcoleaceae bacterium UBA10368]|jgi:GMP synthase - Glutamine amidotransferase domain|nr:GMP synthase [Microcoleaceae cyanobacterium UBA10368]HCV32688.1 GMP synthase [Microcoleaceae cyanobacterium UBA9251]
MRIGILETDQVANDLIEDFGSYADMVEAWLRQERREFLFSRYDVVQEIYPQDISECDAYLITGSRASVYDHDPWLCTLSQFIRDIYMQSTKKLIGICFGHQLIMQSLGGVVYKSPKGWGVGLAQSEVYKTEPWMIPLAKSFKLPVIHQDQVIELPKDATAIAGNPFCPYSVVTYGGSVLTFQGHPEHKKTYTQALMLRRKDVMEETVFSAGFRSLDDDPDAQLVAKWVVNFLEE